MTRYRLAFCLAGLVSLAAAVACAGCGSAAAPAPAAATPAAAADATSLAYSEATSQATWAVLPMGAPAGPNEFWQLFLLTAGHGKGHREGQGQWALDTPPDIATNGAIELAGLAGTALVAGVRPSLDLAYSPVSLSSDGGRDWTAAPPAAGLAAVADALAATPGGKALLALSTTGKVSTTTAAAARWTPVLSLRSLAATAAGRACGMTGLTAVAYSPAGAPLVAGSCRRPGVAGVFTGTGPVSSWRAAGPAVPPAAAGYRVQVLSMTTSSARTTALLQAGSGPDAQLFAASLTASGGWTTSRALSIGTGGVRTTAFGAAGQVAAVLASGRAAILASISGRWQLTPPVPAGHAVTIAFPAAGPVEALAATGGTLAVSQLGASGQKWVPAQTVKVPIQYGSSS
jgi:hypothetical protein